MRVDEDRNLLWMREQSKEIECRNSVFLSVPRNIFNYLSLCALKRERCVVDESGDTCEKREIDNNDL